MVTIREGGVERRVTATEAFLLQHSKRALEGDGAATRTTLAVIEYAKERFSTAHGPYQPHHPHDCGTWERHICTDAAANG